MADLDRGAVKPSSASGSFASTAQNEASDLGSRVSHEASSLGQSVKEGVQSVAMQVKDRAVEQIETQKSGIAERVDDLAESIRRSADGLDDREGWVASLMTRGADELTGFADVIRHRDLGQIAGQVESFARRQPLLFTGLTLSVGFAVARLLKSGSTEAAYGYRSTASSQGRYGSAGTQRYAGAAGNEQFGSRSGSRYAGSGASGTDRFATPSSMGNAGYGRPAPAPRATEMSKHVAGPASDEGTMRERVGVATPGASATTPGSIPGGLR